MHCKLGLQEISGGVHQHVRQYEPGGITRPDGTILCKVTDEVGMRDGRNHIIPMLNWSDDTMQSLTDFASSSANKNFSKDGAMLDKLWKIPYELYYKEEM